MSDNIDIIVQDTINDIIVNSSTIVETIDIVVEASVEEVTIISNPNDYIININRVIGEQVQSDWNETQPNDPSYIKNKPTIPNAQVNSDWNATTGVAEILNKPTIPTQVTNTSELINDGADGVHPFITAQDIPAGQVNSDWNATSGVAEILNKPTIPAEQVNSDWNATSGKAQILNKPTIPSIDGLATITYVDTQDALKVDKIAGKGLSTNDFTNTLKTKLDGIQAGAEVNVNADWNAVSGDAQILNKPTIPSIAGLATITYVDTQDALKVDKVAGKGLSTNDFTNTLKTKLDGIQAGAEVNVNADWNAISGDAQILNKPTIPAAQVNSDWNATSGVAQILNKPTIPDTSTFVPYTGATADVDLNGNDLYLEKLWLNDPVNSNNGSVHFTDGNFHIEDGDGHPLLVVEDEFVQIHKSATIQSNLWTSGLSVTRDHYLPNQSGTIALTSDITGINSGTNTGDETTATIKSKLGITTLSGSNTGDQDLSGLVPNTRTINTKALSSDVTLTTGDIADSTDKRYVTDANLTTIGNQSGTNTGDNAVNSLYSGLATSKQDTLVSGTNIKTINGNSVLGSGDLTISGGSGLQGIHAIIPLNSSAQTSSSLQSNTGGTGQVFSVNRLVAYPFIPAQSFTTSNLQLNVSTIAPGSLGRIAVYSDLNGVPDTSIFISSDLDFSTLGIKTAITSISFVAGTTYWLAFHGNGISCGLNSLTPAQMIPIRTISPSSAANYIFRSVTFASGTPTTFGVGSYAAGNIALVYITKA